MLTPEYLEDLPEAVVKLYQEAEDAILADMARRVVNMDLFSPASVWQLKKLQEAGALTDDILEELSKRTHKTKAELRKLLQEAANISLDFDEGIYEDEGLMGDPLSASEPLRRILNAGYRKTLRTMQNLTGTTARTATQQFERALDKAWLKVNSGAFSSDQAVRDAVKELSERGVESITYRKNGHVTRTDTLEVATRRAVVTGVNQTCGELQIERAKELGADLMELSAHAGARPTHAEWQGKIVSLSGQPGYLSLDDIGYGDVTGFKGANCRHDWSPYFEGAPRTWAPEALAELNAKKYTYNGKELTQYEASQIQRKNERELRRWKREYKAMQAAGQDTSEAASKIAYWNKRQDDFLKQTGFKRQQSREEIAGFSWKDQKAASKQATEAIEGFGRQGQKIASEPVAEKHAEVLQTASDVRAGQEPTSENTSSADNGVDVTAEYREKATPGVGEIKYEDGYDMGPDHKAERDMAQRLRDTYGGDITLLKESKPEGQECPDYAWRGRFWELKSLQSKTYNKTDKRIQKGFSQISENRGGIILDYTNSELDIETAIKYIKRSARTRIKETIDIIVVKGDDIRVFRFEK